jgi:manganese-dependent inorganic pyrophosphatase
MSHIYVTGHRNPDLDSIGSAIGYAELKSRIQPRDTFEPVRLGEVNAQTAWALERAGLPVPALLEHARLRVMDVMRPLAVTAGADEPVRQVGLRMAECDVDLAPVVDEDGALTGVLTERELARQYIRESRGASAFADRPVRLSAIADVLGGEVLVGEDHEITGRLWVIAADAETMARHVGAGDIAVLSGRPDVQRRAIEVGIDLLVTSQDSAVEDDVLALARERGVSVAVSPFDSYVTGRMIGLAVPVRAIMSSDVPAMQPEDLLADVTPLVLEQRAAFAVDDAGHPIGIVTRSTLVDPVPRQVLLVDHAESAQSVLGIEEAEIVEILDHHHIGSIETRVPVRATFDPVGSTATLVVERFRREGREPKRPTATMLLAALLSDTVILTSPTATDRDERVLSYLEELLELDAREFGTEMFRATSDVSGLPAEKVVERDAKEYGAKSGQKISIAQIEVVGDDGLLERRQELLSALEARRLERGYALDALMVTDIVAKRTELLVAGSTAPVERAFGVDAVDGGLDLPGVMSRKKQVAPKLLPVL